MAKKVVTFGEIMLPSCTRRILSFCTELHPMELPMVVGEANVAISLANYGMDASFVTKLPAHEIGQAGVNSFKTVRS